MSKVIRIKKADVAKRHAIEKLKEARRKADKREQRRKATARFMQSNKSNFIH